MLFWHKFTLTNFLFTDCTGFECPRGSVCRVCEETGRPYCEFSCLIDNGGCPLDARCVSTSISCPPGQCCSPNVTCDEGRFTDMNNLYISDV